MLIHREYFDTKEIRSACRRLEKAIKDLNNLRLFPFCGQSAGTVCIHSLDERKDGLTNGNCIATLDGVFADGGDY